MKTATPYRDRLTADLTPEQAVMVQAWRADALMKMPYFSRILFSLRVVSAPGLGTFAVDQGHRLYIDFDAVQDESQASLAWSLLHECGHLFQDHAAFAEALGVTPAQHKTWNVAGDFAINDDLRDAGASTVTEDWMKMLPAAIGEPDYQTPQHYFRKLLAKQPPQPPQQGGQSQQGQSGQGGQQGQQGQGSGSTDPNCPQHGNQSQQGQSGQQPGQQGQQQNGQSGQGAGQQQGSQQGQGGGSQPGQQQGQQQGGHAHGQSGQPCTCPPMPQFKGCGSGSGGEAAPCELALDDDLDGTAAAASKVEKENINVATAAAIKDYAAKGRGTVPGGMVELATKILAPSKTPWQMILRSFVRRAVASKMGQWETDRSRRSRRHHNASVMTSRGRRKIVVPGYVQPLPRLVVVRDTSGSMSSKDMAAAGREIEAVAKQLGVKGDDLMVMDVDAGVHQVVPFKDRRSIQKVEGRGGTNMCVGIEAACEMNPQPTAIVVLTDGGTPWPQTKPPVPVVAAIIPQQKGRSDESYLSHLPDFIKGVVVESGDK